MRNKLQQFAAAVRNRSRENRDALARMHPIEQLISPAFSILRQELDSMVRVIFLLSQTKSERTRLINDTASGVRWSIQTKNGKAKRVTDKEMIELAQRLEGWTLSVYRFGCAFIHLSDFHNHLASNPFETLPDEEKKDVLMHLRHYHGGPATDEPSMEEIVSFVPRVFEKISASLERHLLELEK